MALRSIEGTLKMTAPLSFGLMHLSNVIDAYAHQHPDLNFELDFSDRHVDLVEEGYELAIRIRELQDSSTDPLLMYPRIMPTTCSTQA